MVRLLGGLGFVAHQVNENGKERLKDRYGWFSG